MIAAERDFRIAIVGTGFAGLCMGIQLKKAGMNDFVLFEKAARIGGTWRDNTYPGAECDVPSVLYSFSFERNPDWSHKWSEQAEILTYLEGCARKYDLYPHIRFDSELCSASFDETSGRWRLGTSKGPAEDFDVLVSAVGQLHRPYTPAIEGADTFRGASFHSARWDHRVPLEGKRIASIGNAASAVQFIPQIAPLARRLTVFQRSANWILPKNDRAYTRVEKHLGRFFPLLGTLGRFWIWFRAECMLYPLMNQGAYWWRKYFEWQARRYLKKTIQDPTLRATLTPDYPVGAKRILFSDDIYDALGRENVHLVTDPIRRITATGIVTEDGRLHEQDVIIYATGFQSTSFLTPMRVQGRGGAVLNEIWEAEGAEAYLGITHAGFPNFFMMYGPNTNLGHNSIIIMIESQARYIQSCLESLRDRPAKWLDVKPSIQKQYNAWLHDRLGRMIWTAVERSWYKTSTGKVTNNWAGRTSEYIKRTRAMNPDDYEFAM